MTKQERQELFDRKLKELREKEPELFENIQTKQPPQRAAIRIYDIDRANHNYINGMFKRYGKL